MTTYKVGEWFAVIGKEAWGLKPNTTGHEAAIPARFAIMDLGLAEATALLELTFDPEDPAFPDPLPVELWKNPTPPRAGGD
jgi:hypothetical protein